MFQDLRTETICKLPTYRIALIDSIQTIPFGKFYV